MQQNRNLLQPLKVTHGYIKNTCNDNRSNQVKNIPKSYFRKYPERKVVEKKAEYKPKVLDPRYRAVRDLIQGGSISKLSEIFEILPRSLMAKDMHMNYKSLLNKTDHPNLFTADDMMKMGSVVGISEDRIFTIVLNSIRSNSKKTKDKPSE